MATASMGAAASLCQSHNGITDGATWLQTGDCNGNRRVENAFLISVTTLCPSAPMRSSLLMNSSVGILSARSAFHSNSVWFCMPSAAEITSTAPSSTLSARSTSAAKSICPGVSMRFMRTPFHTIDVEAARTDIPRLRSTSSQSVGAVPSSTLPGARASPQR